MAISWEDHAIVLSIDTFGETRLRADILTEFHGRYSSMLSGSRKSNAGITPGAEVLVRWRARLPEHMGTAAIELVRNPVVDYWSHSHALSVATAALSSAALVPEREPNTRMFYALKRLCYSLAGSPDATCWLAQWELIWLEEMGFALQLHRCAVHNQSEIGKLCFVSPRSGQAVCAVGATGWESRMLPLPAFLLWDNYDHNDISAEDALAALNITGRFMRKALEQMDSLGHWQQKMRDRVISDLKKQASHCCSEIK